jgi:VIT1/CCC1 family predicted Fe2+/Mn2+ transporter
MGILTKRLITSHIETHSKVSWMRDVILGGQDGLVNVLGIVLGVSAASQDKNILIAASMAAAFAEAVSMAAVAYTSTLAQIDHYKKEVDKEKNEIETDPEAEKDELREIYRKKGFSGQLLEDIVSTVTMDKENWLQALVKEELGLEKIDKSTIFKISATVGVAALIASFVPVTPFFFLPHSAAVIVCLISSAVVLFGLGAYEAKTYVGSWIKRNQLTLIGLEPLRRILIGKIFR